MYFVLPLLVLFLSRRYSCSFLAFLIALIGFLPPMGLFFAVYCFLLYLCVFLCVVFSLCLFLEFVILVCRSGRYFPDIYPFFPHRSGILRMFVLLFRQLPSLLRLLCIQLLLFVFLSVFAVCCLIFGVCFNCCLFFCVLMGMIFAFCAAPCLVCLFFLFCWIFVSVFFLLFARSYVSGALLRCVSCVSFSCV